MVVYLLFMLMALYTIGEAQAAPASHQTAAGAAGSADGLIVKQFAGGVTKYISQFTPTGVRIDSDRHEYYLICHAPEWKVYVVNNERKEMAIVSHHDWCTKYQLKALSWVASLRAPLRASGVVVDGHRQTTYYFGATDHIPNAVEMRSDVKIVDRDAGPNHAEVVTLDYPGVQMTGPIMMRLRGLPPLPGILLTARRYIGDPRKNEYNGAIDTRDKLFNQKIADSVFVPPTGYKIVPFTAQLVETETARANTTDLIKDFMIDSK